MSEEPEWGAPIIVNGKRPEWLTGCVACNLKTRYGGWCYSDDFDVAEEPAEDWAWSHTDGTPCIVAIALLSTHPYYAALSPSPSPLSEGAE